MDVSRSVPTLETSSNEQDRKPSNPQSIFNGDKTYDNRTRNTMKSENYLYKIEHRSQAQVSYWDEVWRESVTRAAVRMGWKGWGCEQGTRAHTMGVRVGNEHRDVETTVEQSKSISMQ